MPATIYELVGGQWRALASSTMPPRTVPMWIGAHAGDGGDQTAFAAADQSIGPLRVRRSFNNNIPASYALSSAGRDVDRSWMSFLSCKAPPSEIIAGDWDSEITQLAASFPTDRTSWLTFWHEPENDMDGPTFVAMHKRVYGLVKTANASIQYGYVAMSFQWGPHRNGRTDRPDDWWMGENFTDFLAVDDYNTATTSGRTTPADDPEFQRWYGWASSKDAPLIVTEYGRMNNPDDPQARGRELLEADQWLSDHGFSMWLYWDDTGKAGDWRLTDQPSIDAWRQIAERGRTS